MTKPNVHSVAGKRLIAGLTDVLSALESGGMQQVKKQFRVRRVKLSFPHAKVTASDVVAIRKQLEVSQPKLAGLLGVSTNTVRAWERGANPLSRMASRFLDEVRRNPEYWKRRVEELMA